MKEANPRPNPYVWWFVAGLPLGLVVMGALSFIFYFQKRHQRETQQPSRFASMMRKDVSMDDFKRYERAFRDIGDRSLLKPENLAATASFIDSTLGLNNMGYATTRREFDIHGTKVATIEAELRGTNKPRDLVLVIGRYDGIDSRGIAAMLCVANALTGTQHARTVRFLAVASGDDGTEKNNVITLYRDWISPNDYDAITVVTAESSPENTTVKAALSDVVKVFVPLPLTQNVSPDELKQCESLIQRLTDSK